MTARALYTKPQERKLSGMERLSTVRKRKKTDFEKKYVYSIEELEKTLGVKIK